MEHECELKPSSSELYDNSVLTNQVTLPDSQGVIISPLPDQIDKRCRNGNPIKLFLC